MLCLWLASLVLVGAVRPMQDLGAEAERKEAFQELFRRYFAHYQKGQVRSMLLPHEIPIQYEFEVPKNMYDMKMTPELLLMRGGISSTDFAKALGPAFDSGSPWWRVEVDGIGGKHHQVLQGLPEANSVVVRPRTVLNSSLPTDLAKYLEKLKVPASVHKQSFQFTLGVPLERIGALLKRMPHMHKRHAETSSFCRQREPSPCSRQYEGLLLLCQMVREQAAKCSACGFPKRCQTPWLLRTHIGDLTQTLQREERERLVEEVLQLWGGDEQLYPKGIMDYLHFPDMAEMGGMVKKRLGPSGAADEMPTQLADLLKLAARMLENREHVDEQLRSLGGRPCQVNAPGKPWNAPSARQWLQGAQEGRDLMSDHDSAAAKASLSSTLWRSMGSWRWSPEEPRIFLECRNPQSCLGFHEKSWRQLSYEEMLREAAMLAQDLETP